MVRSHRNKAVKWGAAVVLGALSAACVLAGSDPAHAGFLDFLFGGFQQQPATPPPVNSYAEPSAPGAPLAAGPESLRQGNGSSGRFVAFCVRLCDGQHFPLEHIANATPVETCRAMCPASKTKVFFGSQIDHAVAHDGARYTGLGNAYVYRDHLVPSCTCNGRDAFGLAPIDVMSDPTLRPGDIVSTRDGLMAYSGNRGQQTAEFTPVDASTLAAELNQASSHARLSRRTAPQPVAEEEPGFIVRPPAEEQAYLRGQIGR